MSITLTPTSSGTPSWDLADYDDVMDIITSANLKIIDDPDNDGTENLDLVQRCGDYSDAYIYARMASFGYAVPLAGMDSITTQLLANISATYVIWQLNQARALLTNETVDASVIDKWWDDASGQLSSMGLGTLVITADRATGFDNSAEAITGRLNDNTINASTLANPRACGIW